MNTYVLLSADHDNGWGTAGNISFGGITQAESIEEAIVEKFEYDPFYEDNVFESCLMDDASEDECSAWEDSDHPLHKSMMEKVQAKMRELALQFYNTKLEPGFEYDEIHLDHLYRCFVILEITPDGNVTMYPNGTKFSLQDEKPDWSEDE
jgi:hypothetical protein